MTEQVACPILRPTLRMRSDEQIRTIHNSSLDILSGTGIEMRYAVQYPDGSVNLDVTRKHNGIL
jgi:hypothetical protein